MKYILPFIPVIFSALFFSCEDSPEEIVDTSAPSISITMPPGKSLTGTVNISAMLEDLSEEVYVKILLDGVVKKEGSAKSITFELDTRTISDGPHTLTIEAADSEGNTKQFETQLVVRNTLLIVHVPDGYVEPNTEIYYVISKNDGSLIAYEKVINGGTISIPTPEGFNPDSSFVVTQFFHSELSGSYLINTSNIFSGVYAGEYGLPEPLQARTISGQHTVDVSGIPEGYFEMNGKNTVSIYGWSYPSTSFNLGMFEAKSDLFFFAYAGHGTRPSYLYLPEITSEAKTIINVSDLPLMNEHATTLNEAASEYAVSITGYDTDLRKGIRVYTDNIVQNVTSIPAYYPATTFPNYLTEMSAASSGLYHKYISVCTAPPSAFKYIDANPGSVVYNNKKVEAKTTGEFDYGSAASSRINFEGSVLNIVGNAVYYPKGHERIVMPSFPQELLDKGQPSVENVEFEWMYVYDVESVHTAEDYSAQVVFSPDGKFLRERPQVSTSLSLTQAPGGRASTSREKLPTQVQAVLDRYMP